MTEQNRGNPYFRLSPRPAPRAVLGLIGHPVAHSLSPQIQNAISGVMGKPYIYVNFDVLPEELENAVRGLRALQVTGFNVTMPHKEAILPFLDGLSEEAARIGSVNTVLVRDNKLYGFNTDCEGFQRSLLDGTGRGVEGDSVCLLGAGGSAKAVAAGCLQYGCGRLLIWNRTASRAAALRETLLTSFGAEAADRVFLCDDPEEGIRAANLVINTTSCGMGEQREALPIPPTVRFDGKQRVCDLIYNPARTVLLQKAEAEGAVICNGMGMLFWQAVLAWEIWSGCPVEPDRLPEIRQAIEEGRGLWDVTSGAIS